MYGIILLNRLEKRLEEGNIKISPNQAGFRKKYRTSDHIFVLTTIVTKIVKINKNRLYVAFIDFQKAYDSINRRLLLQKLKDWNIEGLFYENIKAMYQAVFYNVKVRGGFLDPISSVRGVMQGDVLSPCLFNIFIDDIKYIFDESCDPINLLGPDISHLLYADDLILMATSEKGLNNCLSRLFDFCKKWELTVNMKKSNVMILNDTGTKLKGRFLYGNSLLQITNQYCYLGIEIKSSGSFTIAKDTLAEKARKAMMPLVSTVFQFNIPISKAIGLFHSYIKPITLYNAEILNTFSPRQILSLTENTSDL